MKGTIGLVVIMLALVFGYGLYWAVEIAGPCVYGEVQK